MNQNINKNTAYAALGIAGAVAGLMAAVRIFSKSRNAGMKTQSVSRLSEAGRAVYAFSCSEYGVNYTLLSYNRLALERCMTLYYMWKAPGYVRRMDNEDVLNVAKKYNLNKIVVLRGIGNDCVFERIQEIPEI